MRTGILTGPGMGRQLAVSRSADCPRLRQRPGSRPTARTSCPPPPDPAGAPRPGPAPRPLVLVLLAAAVLTTATGDWTNATVIILVDPLGHHGSAAVPGRGGSPAEPLGKASSVPLPPAESPLRTRLGRPAWPRRRASARSGCGSSPQPSQLQPRVRSVPRSQNRHTPPPVNVDGGCQ